MTQVMKLITVSNLPKAICGSNSDMKFRFFSSTLNNAIFALRQILDLVPGY
jgi:hypothetical protein